MRRLLAAGSDRPRRNGNGLGLDPDSLLESSYQASKTPRVLTESEQTSTAPEGTLALWSFHRMGTTADVLGTHTGVAEAATGEAVLFDSPDHVRMNRFGRSKLTFPFTMIADSADAALRFDVLHVRAKRVYMPYEGHIRIRVQVDGHDIGTYAPILYNPHASSVIIPAWMIDHGRHELTLTLLDESSTTYWVYRARLTTFAAGKSW